MLSPTRRQFLHAGAALPAAPLLAAGPKAAKAPKGPKFRLGLVTWNLAHAWGLPTLLEVCASAGISPVELRTTHKHGVEPTLSKAQRREARRRFEGSGVQFWGCGSVCEFHSTDEAEVKRQIETCKKFVGLTADLGGKGVKVRPNRLVPGVPAERTLEQIGKALVPCGRAAADAGVEIWVEVHGPGTQLPANMKKIMEACAHPKVGITWNSNPTDVKNGSVAESFDLLKRWVRSCHINELYRQHDGRYPYRELFRLLRGHGYDRATLIEVGHAAATPAAGAELLRYYKALWTELNRE